MSIKDWMESESITDWYHKHKGNWYLRKWYIIQLYILWMAGLTYCIVHYIIGR